MLYLLGWSKTEVADTLGLHRHTVASHLKLYSFYTPMNLEFMEGPDAVMFGVELTESGVRPGKLRTIMELLNMEEATIQRAVAVCEGMQREGETEEGSRVCRGCGFPFEPDVRQRNRQRFCSSQACRKASKRYSQRKWSQGMGKDYWK